MPDHPDRPNTERPKRRTARVRLDPNFLRHLLVLPDDAEVVAADASNDPVGIELIVASASFPEVEYDAESPRAWIHQESIEVEGRTFVRISKIEVSR